MENNMMFEVGDRVYLTTYIDLYDCELNKFTAKDSFDCDDEPVFIVVEKHIDKEVRIDEKIFGMDANITYSFDTVLYSSITNKKYMVYSNSLASSKEYAIKMQKHITESFEKIFENLLKS